MQIRTAVVYIYTAGEQRVSTRDKRRRAIERVRERARGGSFSPFSRRAPILRANLTGASALYLCARATSAAHRSRPFKSRLGATFYRSRNIAPTVYI